jgi:nicotinate phosphoribosyltransferase
MSLLAEVYRLPLALLTDLYQLTMAQGYRRAGKGEVEGVFHLFFRRNPFEGGFAVACGLARVVDYVTNYRFGEDDVAYLAARGDDVIDFGLRRAQGIDGGLSASRAAFVGGAHATSNALAGRLFGLPVGGTHAHSWVMAFDDETEAFKACAGAQPNNAVFLVDTYDTLEGVRHAAKAALELRASGHQAIGIRLDSGDLAYLSIEARRILDAAGLQSVKILASNDLDEHLIASLKEQGARIDVWGVGTRLVTGGDQPALGGVYKLGAVREPGGAWRHRIKVSEQAAKTSTPGIQQVRRFSGPEGFVADVIFEEESGIGEPPVAVDPLDPTRRKRIPAGTPFEDLLVPVVRGGRVVYEPPPLRATQARAKEQVARLHLGIRRFVNPHQYPVGLSLPLHELKTRLVLEARGS